MVLLYSTAFIIIIGLAAVAGFLHWKLYLVTKTQHAQKRELELKEQKNRQDANQSIQIICRAYLQGQVGAAEASIRVCGLLDQLQVSVEQRGDWVAFAKMADAVRHIPILDKWKALPKKEQHHFEKIIEHKEQEMAASIRQAAEKMLDQSF